jgi:hypothetical protein
MSTPPKPKPQKRKVRKDKKQLLRQKNRRTQIIMEAKRIHDKTRKKAKEKERGGDVSVGVSAGMTVKTMEQQDLALAIGMGVSKGISKAAQIGGNALERLKKRSRALKKSKTSHLKRLKSARKTMKQRARS